MKVNLADGTLFGNDAGEDEIPSVLASYFVDQPSFSTFFSRETRFQIARSRKGMGKSSLLSKLAFDLARDEEPPILVRATGANLMGIAEPKDFNLLSLQNFWTKVLCARVNYEIGKNVGFAFSDTSMALVESAEISGFKERNIVGALLSRIKSNKIPIEIRTELYPNSEELLKRAQLDNFNRRVWLLIDDIDSTYIDTPDQQAFVSSFFSACRALVRDIVNLYIRVTVRTDVWTNFTKNQDLDKSEQYITDISWTSKELERVLAKKIFAYLDRNFQTEVESANIAQDSSPEYLMKFAFRPKMQWGRSLVTAFRPIQILSSGRPRWMSQLCRLAGQQAAKQRHDLIGIQDINSVLNRYTRYRLDDLQKEHEHQFKDLEKLVNTFANKKARYLTSELIDILGKDYVLAIGAPSIPPIDGYPYKSPIQLAHFLFKIGFIAARREHRGHSEFAEFVRHEERPELLTDVRNLDDGLQWEIYPSYRDALGIMSAGRAARARPRGTPGHVRSREIDKRR